MDLSFSPEDEAFRAEVRDFLAARLPETVAEKVRTGRNLSRDDMHQWQCVLDEKGWYANHWPLEWGGPGWTVSQKFIFDVETALAYAPRIVPFGVSMLGPVLIKYGSEEQKQHWLPRIRSGADWWCQGFSEPGAGSDLAGLKTTAVRDNGCYVVNGQKTWTTLAQYANMIFCLVRTDPAAKKQQGISFLLVDMRTPGVEVRPIKLLDGDYEVNEVFFTDVRVPAENLVGNENEGWTYAKYLLSYERTNIAGIGGSMAALARLKHLASSQHRGGRPVSEDRLFAARLARVEIELENLVTTNLRILAAARGGAVPLADSAMLKIRGTEIRQEISSLARRALGPQARIWAEGSSEEELDRRWNEADDSSAATLDYLNNRKLSIFGGSNEVQRAIISKSLLGL